MPADLLKIKALHPEWNIVDIQLAPNGGIWALGADGGIFPLNSEGGTDGTVAPTNTSGAFGYTGLAAEQRQGERTFNDIRFDEKTGQYTLYSTAGETYAFNAPITTAPITAPQVDPVTVAPSESGKDVFINSLLNYGFTREQAQSLGTTLWTNSKTKSQDALYIDLLGSQEYKDRFPGMAALREQGTAISESQYITFERQYKTIAQSYQLPDSFHDDHGDFGALIAKGVSPEEYGRRLGMARTAVLSDPTFLDELAREVPGANLGDATAFFLDPEKGQAMIEEKFVRAQYGTSARTTGFGALSEQEKNRLTAAGTTADQAQAGFADLSGGIMANTIEESISDNQFTRDEAVGYVAEAGKGGASTSEFTTRKQRRAANFQGGGGAAGGNRGKTGIG